MGKKLNRSARSSHNCGAYKILTFIITSVVRLTKSNLPPQPKAVSSAYFSCKTAAISYSQQYSNQPQIIYSCSYAYVQCTLEVKSQTKVQMRFSWKIEYNVIFYLLKNNIYSIWLNLEIYNNKNKYSLFSRIMFLFHRTFISFKNNNNT